MNPRRRILILSIAMLIAAARTGLARADTLSFPPTDFVIRSADSGAELGKGRYEIESTSSGSILHGVNRYFDSQTDVETSHIDMSGDQPKQLDFDHTFYGADGSLQRRGYLNFNTGDAACTDNTSGVRNVQSTMLKIPADTWAGASIAIPVQNILRSGAKGSTRQLHVFSCAPGPKILPIDVNVDPTETMWPAYGADALRVEIKPDFGWVNVIVESFVPKLHAWFDPAQGYAFLGDEASRYYNGPHILLVKAHGGDTNAAPRPGN